MLTSDARRRLLRTITFAGGLVAVMAAPEAAHADGTARCIEGSDQGQVLRDRGGLLAARDAFLGCSNQACPGPIRADCAAWFADVDRRIPSIVLRPRDARGHDLTDVRVFDGGRLLVTVIDGRPISLDPGQHELRFERAGAAPILVRIVARETEKGRIVDVMMPAAGNAEASRLTPSQEPPGAAVPPAAWILGGVGLLGVGAFGYFGWTAKSEAEEMRRTCAPFCDEARVDDTRTRVLVANVSLGVGVVALGTATYLLLTHDRTVPQERTSSVRLLVEPRAGGLEAGLSGVF